ncbi:MAG: hypothetical protein EZS28_021960, partial [Streblomastix strix]
MGVRAQNAVRSQYAALPTHRYDACSCTDHIGTTMVSQQRGEIKRYGDNKSKLRLSEDSNEIAVKERIISLCGGVIKLLGEISSVKSEKQMIAIRKGIKIRIPKLSIEDEQDEIDDEWMWDVVIQQLARIYRYIISNSKVESNVSGECNLLNALKYGTNQETHRLALVWLSDVYHNLEPLFHIDCTANLKCSKCITFPDSFSTEDLHLLALEVLAKCKDSITPVIISFAAKTSFQLKYSMTIELSSLLLIQAKYLPSEHRFVVNLNLLHSLIVNNSRYSDSIASFPNLLPVLIAFTFYNRKNREEITDVNDS